MRRKRSVLSIVVEVVGWLLMGFILTATGSLWYVPLAGFAIFLIEAARHPND